MFHSPLTTMGGKFGLAPWICSFLPTRIEGAVVDAFGGAAHWTMKVVELIHTKKLYVKGQIIYNDLNDDLYNFFVVTRDPQTFKRLLHFLRRTPTSKKQYAEFKKIFEERGFTNDIERAAIIMYLHNLGLGGHPLKGLSVAADRNHARKFRDKVENLRSFRETFRIVNLFNTEYSYFFNRFNDPNSLIYCDPPYIGTEHYYRQHRKEFSHTELAEYANNSEARVIISYYPKKILKRLYQKPKWRWFTKEVFKNASNMQMAGKKTPATELLLMNYDYREFKQSHPYQRRLVL